jgi:TolB-like protein
MCRRARAITVAAAGVAAAVLAAAPQAAAAPDRLMVLYFDNNTSDKTYDPLAKGMADMMITDLTSVPGLEVVEREKLEALLGELRLQRSKYFDPKTAQRIGKGVGAAFAVTGAFLSMEPNIRIDVRVLKIDSATVVKAGTVNGRKDDFFALWQKLSAELVAGLAAALPGASADKARAAAQTQKVDNLGTVLDYARGLEARDQGDLDAASRHLQKVVSASPDFQLGKDRYRQIMKALYDAKGRREALLGGSEKRLLESIDKELKGGGPKQRLGYRVLLGQYHLTKTAEAVNAGRDAAAYRAHVRGYVDNQLRLYEETQGRARYDIGGSGVSSEDVKLAEEIGIKLPGNTFGIFTPSEVLREMNQFLMKNSPSIHRASLDQQKAACFYRLDTGYPKIVTGAYEKALGHIAKHEPNYREREIMRTLQEYAGALARLGRSEEAIAKLQGGLDQFPKAEEFKDVEKLLREILEGKQFKAWCKDP